MKHITQTTLPTTFTHQAAPSWYRDTPTASSQVLSKVVTNHCTLFPAFHVGFFAYMGLLEGCSVQQVRQRCGAHCRLVALDWLLDCMSGCAALQVAGYEVQAQG